ncbi:MAG: restriction endonuclease [Sphingomonas sp.]
MPSVKRWPATSTPRWCWRTRRTARRRRRRRPGKTRCWRRSARWPDAFERLAQRLLRESGFVRVEVTGKSGDGGIDGSGVLRMNLISFQVLFQCKRYAGSVPSSTVRDFRGAMQGRADKGLIITTGTFTADARREATRDGAPAIDLIDGEALCQLLKERGLGVQVRPVVTEEVTVVPAFFADI